MPIAYDWGNFEETLLVSQFVGQWTLDDYRHATQGLYDLAHTRAIDLVLIVDLRRACGVPTGFMPVAFQYARLSPPNIKKVIIITRTSLWQKLWETIQLVFGQVPLPLSFVKDVDAAYAIASHFIEL